MLAANRRALEAGKKTYPKKLLVLKQELEERLYQQVGKPVEVCILADLFSIQEEAWTNAIEGYIHNQKLNLVVEAEYFMDAYRIYRSIKEEKRFIPIPLWISQRQSRGNVPMQKHCMTACRWNARMCAPMWNICWAESYAVKRRRHCEAIR